MTEVQKQIFGQSCHHIVDDIGQIVKIIFRAKVGPLNYGSVVDISDPKKVRNCTMRLQEEYRRAMTREELWIGGGRPNMQSNIYHNVYALDGQLRLKLFNYDSAGQFGRLLDTMSSRAIWTEQCRIVRECGDYPMNLVEPHSHADTFLKMWFAHQ